MNSSEDSREVRETCSHFPKATLACLRGSGLLLVQKQEASCFLLAPKHFGPLFLLFHVPIVANEDDDRHARARAEQTSTVWSLSAEPSGAAQSLLIMHFLFPAAAQFN